MTYEDIKFYLKTNLKSPSLDFDWTDEDNTNFFNFMQENVHSKFLHDKENLLIIREAFASYFEPVGYILFKIKIDQIKLKVLPYSVEAQQSRNVNQIINILDENENSITSGYKGRDDQIYIDNSLREKIFAYVQTIKNEKVNAKELVRFSVRKGLELKDEDLIMLKQDCIFVKLCDMSKKLLTKEPVDRRFNGIDEKEMEEFCKEHFSGQENKNFLFITAKLFVEKYFLEKEISNHDYEKKVFQLIQLIIAKQLMDKFDHCEDFFKGFAGYIFRRNFQSVFEYIAELVLHEISISNDYMIEFLKYYSLNILVIDGRKYQVPSLETEGNLRWNVVSMLSIVKIYLKAKTATTNTQHRIDKAKVAMAFLYVDGVSPIEFNNKNTDEKNKIENILAGYEKSLEYCRDSLNIAQDESEKEELEDEIESIKIRMQEKREEKKELTNKSVKRKDIHKFAELENNIASMTRGLEKEKKILHQNKDSFDSIKNALVKALISKKRVI